ncbi:hypothetical protein DFA_08101 [Cavenderia fasciculata]|uniref:Helicase ATP-binding domain-containing protein n=1 Tax=Cavenderia fasciculata TaxID=261658 RepID=F4Q560_CACFS|nr:uncharacterized protein DFA_08101 [Cavenderia fasciculata]EGG17119.1 hypothetical protein DFA_08101 [Cavenderia fasciculata]|eukprot:XP_004355603.1 hypothetical protein DFA_08101 [Cavenderia fasciculata]
MTSSLTTKVPSAILRITNGYSYLKNVDSMVMDAIRSKLTFTLPKANFVRFKTGAPKFNPSVSFITPKTGRFATGLLPIISLYLREMNVDCQRIDERNPLPNLYSNWDYSKVLPGDEDLTTIPSTIIQDTKKGKKKSTTTSTTTTIKKKKKLILDDDEEPTRLFDLQTQDLEPKQVDESLLSPKVTLHDYQVESINFALSNHRGIIKCATGGGKTLILASLIKAIGSNVETVILVTKRSLITQIYETLVNTGVCTPGRISTDYNEPNTVTIATLQSVHKIQDLCKDAKVLLVDEVHEFGSPTAKKAFELFDNAYARFGFSATPFKIDNPVHNHKITSTFGTLLCDISTKSLTDINILSKANIHFYPIKYPIAKHLNLPKSHIYQDMENVFLAENDYLNESIAKLVDDIPTGRIMILVKRLSQGDALAKLIPSAYWVKGDDNVETREYVLHKLKYSTGTKVVAIFSSIGYVGLDVRVHHLINASGGRDPNTTLQKLGRGLRKADDKEFLDYHDFYFDIKVNKHLEAHSSSRINVLKKEGHSLIMEKEILPPPPPPPHIITKTNKKQQKDKDKEEEKEEEEKL